MKQTNNIKICAIGGLNEIGKNLYLIEENNEIIIIDCGILFPDYDYGINYIIPNFNYLKENENIIVGLFITHGHEDHIGAIPHLLKEVNIPKIYASGIATSLIKIKLNEFNISANIIEYDENSVFSFDNFSISFYQNTHSIPDSYGIAIKTHLGYIIHSGDFKFDFALNSRQTNFNKITQYAKEGVLLLMSDSTNANSTNNSLSERKIKENLYNLFLNTKGRIIISTFASNLFRIQHILNASIKTNRKVIVFGKSMEQAITIAKHHKYFKIKKDCLGTVDDLLSLPDNRITILTTGNQGEPLAALSKMADGIHRYVKFKEDDTIIFSSSAIPGNQEKINRIVNKLYKSGAHVIVNSPLMDTHTSGHAMPAELQLMINLCKPKYFMPIHGEYLMQHRHKELAIECGISEDNCFILKNGEILQINDSKAIKLGKIPTSYYAIDDNKNILDSKIVKERKTMAESGIISITYVVEKNYLVQRPTINSRGFIYMNNANDIIKDITDKAYKFANTYLFKIKNNHFYENKFKEDVKLEIEKYVSAEYGLLPIISIFVIKI